MKNFLEDIANFKTENGVVKLDIHSGVMWGSAFNAAQQFSTLVNMPVHYVFNGQLHQVDAKTSKELMSYKFDLKHLPKAE